MGQDSFAKTSLQRYVGLVDHVRLTPETLKALAHPLRVRLLNLLREQGPATATRLAELTGQSSGATSYHLRQLATYGFVEEDEGQVATGRERWWKAAHARTRLEATEARQAPAETEAYLRSVALLYAERTERWLAEAPLLTPEWDTGATLSDCPAAADPGRGGPAHRRYRPPDGVLPGRQPRRVGAARRGAGRLPGTGHAVRAGAGMTAVADRRSFAWLMTAKAISMFGSRMTFVPCRGWCWSRPAVPPGPASSRSPRCCRTSSDSGRRPAHRPAGCPEDRPLSATSRAPSLSPASGAPRTEGMHFGLWSRWWRSPAARGFGDTAKQVLFPAAVRAAGVDMTRATAIMDGINRASILIGAPLAGVAGRGHRLADGAAVGRRLVPGVRRHRRRGGPPGRDDEPGGAGHVVVPGAAARGPPLRAAGQAVARHHGDAVRHRTSSIRPQVGPGAGVVEGHLRVAARDRAGSAAFAAGAVTGNLAYLWLAPRLPRFAPFAIGFLIGGAPRLVAMALDTPLWTILAVSAWPASRSRW